MSERAGSQAGNEPEHHNPLPTLWIPAFAGMTIREIRGRGTIEAEQHYISYHDESGASDERMPKITNEKPRMAWESGMHSNRSADVEKSYTHNLQTGWVEATTMGTVEYCQPQC